MTLSNVQLRKIRRPAGPTIFVINIKKNLICFVKARSNKSNKAQELMIEAKTVIEIKL